MIQNCIYLSFILIHKQKLTYLENQNGSKITPKTNLNEIFKYKISTQSKL